jgi:Zn-dependent peptidase ImmA (M78 family)
MGFTSWEMRAGDPGTFAFKIEFQANPHGDEDRATLEDAASWGAFSVWANGENLCSHTEYGETLDAVHWYLLPLFEWFVENWDALFHEERFPLRNVGLSAAEAMARTKTPSLSLKGVDELDWFDRWAAWWNRHCLRAASEGGFFPDMYLRRYRDKIEVSSGAEPVIGIPRECFYHASNRIYRLPPGKVADSLHRVLTASSRELQRRLPNSSRVAALAAGLQRLESPDRESVRMAWLAGYGENPDAYLDVARNVDEALADTPNDVRASLVGTRVSQPLVVIGSAYARLLYGAISPSTTRDDVAKITRLLVENYVEDATRWLERLDISLKTSEAAQLTPGEQGSLLGEQACELLGDAESEWVDVHAAIERLGIAKTDVELTDDDLRAISVFGPTQRPHIYCNRRTRWGTSRPVERFTLAHELCHLLLDREYGDELAVASGQWAPVEIEQRANTFAAAFLMPTWLLRQAIGSHSEPIDQPGVIQMVATRLRVSVTSLVDRLYNLGEVTLDDRLRLRPSDRGMYQ